MRRRAGDVCQLTDDHGGFMLMTSSCWKYLGGHMSIAPEVCSVPHAYRDLLEGRTCAVLSTVMPDGQPQSTVA